MASGWIEPLPEPSSSQPAPDPFGLATRTLPPTRPLRRRNPPPLTENRDRPSPPKASRKPPDPQTAEFLRTKQRCHEMLDEIDSLLPRLRAINHPRVTLRTAEKCAEIVESRDRRDWEFRDDPRLVRVERAEKQLKEWGTWLRLEVAIGERIALTPTEEDQQLDALYNCYLRLCERITGDKHYAWLVSIQRGQHQQIQEYYAKGTLILVDLRVRSLIAEYEWAKARPVTLLRLRLAKKLRRWGTSHKLHKKFLSYERDLYQHGGFDLRFWEP